MCFISRLTLSVSDLINRFQAELDEIAAYQPAMEFNAFSHPVMPVITNDQPDKIRFFEWGLLPSWAKDKTIQNSTLNARIETLGEKPAFRHVLSQRCLVPADGFYEWQWLDAKGKEKQKYLITVADEAAFAFAGLWNTWHQPFTGETLNTYTLITRPANELMSRIHNTKMRMPWILPRDEEAAWLQGENLSLRSIDLHATPIGTRPVVQTLFS